MSETPFKIESHIPMPSRSDPMPDMPFDDMQVGDSILIDESAISPDREGAIRQRIYRYQCQNPPKRFSLIKDPDQPGAMRLFRVMDRG